MKRFKIDLVSEIKAWLPPLTKKNENKGLGPPRVTSYVIKN